MYRDVIPLGCVKYLWVTPGDMNQTDWHIYQPWNDNLQGSAPQSFFVSDTSIEPEWKINSQKKIIMTFAIDRGLLNVKFFEIHRIYKFSKFLFKFCLLGGQNIFQKLMIWRKILSVSPKFVISGKKYFWNYLQIFNPRSEQPLI